MAYPYENLPDNRSIRVIELVISDGQVQSAKLKPVSLDNCPPYIAVSYTWGSPLIHKKKSRNIANSNVSDTFPLLCDSTVIGISNNLAPLFAFLGTGQRVTNHIWIDAVCMNQNDIEERSAQVELMGDIYWKAEEVIICLGEADKSFENFFWLHDEYLPAIESYINEHGLASAKEYGPFDKRFLQKVGITTSDIMVGKCWVSYIRFCTRRRWFTRVWTSQELALGQVVTVLCGTSTIPWNNLVALARYVQALEWSLPLQTIADSYHDSAPGEIFLELDLIRSVCHSNSLASNHMTSFQGLFKNTAAPETEEQIWYLFLFWLLMNTRDKAATDNRDRVYGMLGMWKRFLPNAMPMPIQPDYKQSVQHVYYNFAGTLFLNTPQLFILSLKGAAADSTGNRQVAPSWVPQLNKASPNLLCNAGRGYAYNVSVGTERVQYSLVLDGERLKLHGAIFDDITELGPCSIKEKTMPGFALDILGILRFTKELRHIYKATQQTRLEAVWRTIIGNLNGILETEYPVSREKRYIFFKWILYILAMTSLDKKSNEEFDVPKELEILNEFVEEENGSAFPSKQDVLDKAEELNRVEMENKDPKKVTSLPDELSSFPFFRDAVFNNFGFLAFKLGKNRKLFRTSCGYIGLCPKYAVPGDKIVYLRGAKVPFVLRPTSRENEFTLVGEVYLHGFMNGEMVTPEFVGKIAPLDII